MERNFFDVYMGIIKQSKDFIDVWPYRIQFKNYDGGIGQRKVIKNCLEILQNGVDRYKIQKGSILKQQGQNSQYIIEFQTGKYIQVDKIWKDVYQSLDKGWSKFLYLKSVLSSKQPKVGYYRIQSNQKLGDKYKPTLIQVYFNSSVILKLEFRGIDQLPVADGKDKRQVLKRFIDQKLEKIEGLKIRNVKIGKDGVAIYYIKYKLQDETAFFDKLNQVLGEWHSMGNGYGFNWVNN